jgi:hypothetical protein
MINHARTLLLNVDSRTYLPDVLGEEYIPTYRATSLPTYLTTARKLLLGSAPDRVFLNFRAQELLSFIHRTELAEFVYALDPRVTYWPKPQSEFFRAKTTITALKTTGVAESRLYINGTLKPDNVRGRAFKEYTVKIINNTTTTATVEIVSDLGAEMETQPIEWLATAPNSAGADVTFTGISNQIPLPNTDLTIQLVTGSLNLNIMAFEDFVDTQAETANIFKNIALEKGADPMQLRAGPPVLKVVNDQVVLAEWLLQVYAKPDSAIAACLPKLDFIGEPFYIELFGVGNTVEPYATFKNIWFNHPSPAYRLAAFTLAVIYRTNELGAGNV